MKQVTIGRDGVSVDEVPTPGVVPGAVLVRVAASCISVGTEMSGVRASNLPLWKRAMARPDQVRRVVEMVRTEGLARTRAAVDSRLAAHHPTGYSLAGTVIEVGDGVDDLAPGDRVACAGSQAAHHAEVVCVPRNLVAPVPDDVPFADAATVTLGAIALQGVRRAEPTLGETVAVVGLGLIGQLTVQLLKANGCRTVGIDPDARRVTLAKSHGLDEAAETDDETQVARLTHGIGADAVIVTAASPSPDLLNGAFRMTRRKGRVVLVGDVPIAIDRAEIYANELDFRISTSYGPGRYDRTYEEAGLDYPVGHVRWTENRNMQAYLDLMADGHVRVDGLIEARFGIDDAAQAYAALDADDRPLAALLDYPDQAPITRQVSNPAARPGRPGAVRLSVIGPGSFFTGTLLPNLQALSDRFAWRGIAARRGHAAADVVRQTGAAFATTDPEDVLSDPDTDAVLIATRHDSHARLVLAALEAGKHVFVEKPLSLTRDELAAIEAFYRDAESAPLLLTGYNRRFSRAAQALAAAVSTRSNPMMIDYRVNAGHLPPEHWVHGPEGGGRNRGEACHFYDLMTFLTDAEVAAVEAQALRPATGHYLASDNFVATLRFADGSLGSLTYTALGTPAHPKERIEVYCDGAVLEIEDFRTFRTTGSTTGPSSRAPAKGHREELVAFADGVQSGDWPIPLWQQLQAARIALDVEEKIG